MPSDTQIEAAQALREEAAAYDDRAAGWRQADGNCIAEAWADDMRATRLRSLAARLEQEPDEAAVERVARAICRATAHQIYKHMTVAEVPVFNVMEDAAFETYEEWLDLYVERLWLKDRAAARAAIAALHGRE